MHRPTGETVLLYGFNDSQRLREINYVMVQMGIRVKIIKDDQIGQTVGFLAGVKGMEENPDAEKFEPLNEEVMVMHNFSLNKRIDLMLSNIKNRGLEGIPLKCIMTSTNKNWTFYQLAKELEKEHALLTGAPLPEEELEEIKAEEKKSGAIEENEEA
ncbi:MAG: DUF3783 domain-containing protein [Lachnospiraceae bacterium]|nr:DUF3783 domain-containing protein [Lachnospiraceae bacterium]